MLAVILNQHLIKKERTGRMQKPRIPPHPTTKQEILFLRRMGFPAQKKMKGGALYGNHFKLSGRNLIEYRYEKHSTDLPQGTCLRYRCM